MYLDPYLQRQLLGPLGTPQSDISQTPTQPITQPLNALTGPLSASQGYVPDPELQRQAQWQNAFQNMASLGGYQIGNPYQQQINQNMELANARMSRLTQQQDPLVRGVQQYAAAAGIQDRPWDEKVQAYRQAKFAPESRTAGMRETDFLLNASPEERIAFFERKGINTQQLPDGSLVSVDEMGNTEVLFDAQTQQLGAKALEAAKTQGRERTQANEGFRANAIQALQQSSAEESVLQGVLDTSEMFLDRIESGDLEGATGVVSGLFSQLGFGPSPMGELDAEQVRMTLANLGITNLAPVTVREIMMVNQMWAEASAGRDINVGRLRSAIRNINRALTDMEHERNRNLGELKRYGSPDDYNHYYDQYGTVDSIEELLGGGSQ